MSRRTVVPDMRRMIIAAVAASLAGCLSHPPPSAPPYHAVGKAADWTLIIDDRFVTFIPGPGQQPLLQPVPRPVIGVAGEMYQTPRINVNVVHRPCNDMRTDRIYPDSIQVYVDGRLYNGCGGL
jgi:hypothetical protein